MTIYEILTDKILGTHDWQVHRFYLGDYKCSRCGMEVWDITKASEGEKLGMRMEVKKNDQYIMHLTCNEIIIKSVLE